MRFFSTALSSFGLAILFLGLTICHVDGWFLSANAQTALPDLTIESLSYTVTAERAEIRYHIANRGTATSSVTTFVRNLLDVDNNILSNRLIGITALAPGESDIRSSRSDSDNSELAHLPAGTRKVRIRVDQDNTIAESNEDNNVQEADRPFPDLTIESLAYTMTGGQAELSFNVANRGTISSGYSTFTWNFLDANGNVISGLGRSIGLEPIAPGASVVRRFRSDTGYPVLASPPTGTVKAQILVDQDHTTDESNESNNAQEVNRPFTDLISDLTIESLSYTMTGGQAELSFNITNRGTLLSGPTTFLWNLLDADGNIVPGVGGHSINLDSLAPGVSVVRSFRSDIGYAMLANPPEGKHKIKVRVDQNNIITESNEDNNVQEVDRPFPDLTIESLSYTITGGQAELSFTVANRGTLTSGYSIFTWDLRDANGNITSSLGRSIGLEPIAPGASGVRSFRSDTGYPVLANPPTDTVKARVQVDQENAIFEFNEENNVQEAAVITETTTGEDLAAIDEESISVEIAQGFAYSPRILPGSPLYFFKNAGREIRSFFVFNPAKKAELRLQITSEKILEANQLANQGKEKALVAHLKNYEEDLVKLQDLTEQLKEKNPEAAQKLVEKSLLNQFKHQMLIEKFEQKATAETLGSIKAVRSKTIERIGQNLSAIHDTQKIEKIVDAALTQNGNPFKSLRNLEVLTKIEEKVSAQAKEALNSVQERSVQQFKNQFEALPKEHRELFSGYLEKASGDKLAYPKIVEAQGEFLKTKTEATKELFLPSRKGTLEPQRENLFEFTKQPSIATPPAKIIPQASQVKSVEVALCIQEYVPVCGIDGRTYANRCVAEKENKTKVVYEGECKKVVIPEIPAAQLPEASLEPLITACPTDYVPVCGTNNKTYDNSCYAKRAEAGVQYDGACKVIAVPLTTTICSDAKELICGTDNKTYTNSCVAKQSNVGVQYSGECKIVAPSPIVTYQCSDGIDNDKDGAVDVKDVGCTDEKDNDETNVFAPSLIAPLSKPVIFSFTATPTAIGKGQSSTLSWSILGATNITLSPTVSLIKETLTANGKKLVTPTLTTTYTITAKNSAGSVSASVTVTVK